MKSTASHDERIAKLGFANVYPMYVAKVTRKGRTQGELQEVIEWLTGFDAKALQKLAAEEVTLAEFFKRAKLNKHASLITGTICGYRIEEIENPLTQQIRYLDKLIDELAQGRAMEKILRSPQAATAAKAASPPKAAPKKKAAPKPTAKQKPKAAAKPKAKAKAKAKTK
jgi:hypothetical protein